MRHAVSYVAEQPASTSAFWSLLLFFLFFFFLPLPLFKPTDVTLLSLRSLKRARWAIERVDVETLRIDDGKSQRRFLLQLVLTSFARVSRCPHASRENTEHGTFYVLEGSSTKMVVRETESNPSFYLGTSDLVERISVFHLSFSNVVCLL